MNVPVTFAPHPMARDIKQRVMQQGVTLAEIVCDVIPGAPWDSVVVHVNDWEAPHGSWHIVRPKSDGDRIVVTVSRRMHGGGGGKKNVLAIVASVALIAVATLATGGFFAAGGYFLKGSISAALLAGAISILGQFAIRQLTAAPGKDGKGESPSAPQLGNAGGGGNTIDLGGPMIRCVGARKVFPKLVCEPLIDLIGSDEYIEAVYAMSGPHAISDLRVEGTDANSVPDLNYEIIEGRNGQPAQSSVNRYGKTDPTQVQFSSHRKKKVTPWYNADTSFSSQASAPQWHVRTSAVDPDEIWIHLVWPEGLGAASGPSFPVAQNFRLRMRIVGAATWTNLPEISFQNNLSGPLKKYVKLIYGGGPVVDASYTNGAWESWHTASSWTSHSSFRGVAGVYNDTLNVERQADGFKIFLDPAVFPPGNKWEVGMMKSQVIAVASSTPSTYRWYVNAANPNNYVSPFGWIQLVAGVDAAWPFKEGFEYVPTACTMLRFISVKNQSPTPIAGDTHITISGINLNVQQVSVMANGLVPDWNGTNWTGEVETSNPAPHLRYLFAGAMTAKPVPADIIDDAEFVAWRTRCATANIKISAAFEGMSLDEVATAIAAVGFGKPRRTDIYGVFHDYNTSSEAPVQVFSPRNANSIVFEKTFTDIPDAFLVRFADESLNYEPNEIVVLRPGADPTGIANPPSVDATGITNAAQLAQNYTYVLNVMTKRGATVSFATNVQSILCRTGNVIGLSHPVISRHAMQGRVKQVKRNVGGLIAGLVLDDVVVFGGLADFMAITDTFGTDDVFATGVALAATAGLLNGTQITQNITWSGDEKNEITFSAPIADVGFAHDGEDKDILVIIGPATTMFARYKVISIEPMGWFDARITALPEAPEIAVLPY